MLSTSARLLRVLTLLESRRDWSGTELAQRLEVSTRTVRNDMVRLRALGYPVEAAPGVAGGYRLGAGAALPPLLLDDDEAVAVAVALRSTTGGGVTGIEETSIRALVKLEQVLPMRLRRRVNALQAYTVPVSFSGPTVEPQLLSTIAAACRDYEVLRIDYRKHDGTESTRSVEPYRLVHMGRRWYLVAWDRDRRAWRTFRVDRLQLRTPNGPRFKPRELPAEDIGEYVMHNIRTAPGRHAGRRVHGHGTT
jgi:predicted DNA-binding transcriptional regulator YafY